MLPNSLWVVHVTCLSTTSYLLKGEDLELSRYWGRLIRRRRPLLMHARLAYPA